MSYALYDMHCHLDRIPDAQRAAHEAERRGIALFCTPLSPAESMRAATLFQHIDNVRIGCGLHPWWIDSDLCGREEITQAIRMITDARWIGEVGLDFGRAHQSSKALQLNAFERICKSAATHPHEARVFSLHAVSAVRETLDVLERYELTKRATCIFHWFSGSSDELYRARIAGCYFSVNEMMLGTKKGREYARQIPEEHLLLETDAPPKLDAPYQLDELEISLQKTLTTLAELRSCDRDALAARIAKTSGELLEF